MCDREGGLEVTRAQIFGLPGAIGIMEDLEIVLSNFGLMLCEVNFYVVAKNTTLAWTLFWAILLGLEVRRLLWVVGIVLYVLSPWI